MQWLEKITYQFNSSWLLNNEHIKTALPIIDMPPEKFEDIIMYINGHLSTFNISKWTGCLELGTAFTGPFVGINGQSLFDKAQRQIFPLDDGYSSDAEYVKLLAYTAERHETYNDISQRLRNTCRYIDGWHGLTVKQRRDHEWCCDICKEHEQLAKYQRHADAKIKGHLEKIKLQYAEQYRERDAALATIRVQFLNAPFTKYIHLSESCADQVIIVTKNDEHTAKVVMTSNK